MVNVANTATDSSEYGSLGGNSSLGPDIVSVDKIIRIRLDGLGVNSSLGLDSVSSLENTATNISVYSSVGVKSMRSVSVNINVSI